jgi:hypothetical protein
MRCESCKQTVSVEELSEVDENFYVDDRIFCLTCAKRRWENDQQSRTMNNPAQDQERMAT